MSIKSIQDAAATLFADGNMSGDDIDKLAEAAGKHVDEDELGELETQVNRTDVAATGADRMAARELVSTLRGLEQQKTDANAEVTAQHKGLVEDVKKRMTEGIETKSFAGTVIPEAVKKLVNGALAAGVDPYDVRTLDDPEKDMEHGGEWIAPGVFTPYPQRASASGTMAFAHTEITPEKVQKDMTTVQTWRQYDGQDAQGNPRYKSVTGKGSGNISAFYDEKDHAEKFARGPNGEIWSNNCALLSDGMLHGLPAMRRSAADDALILTNPSLARGKLMLSNFHLEMSAGVVMSVGVSGRIQNRINDGELVMIDPVAVLRAAGFQLAPGLETRFDGGGPKPVLDPATHVFRKA